MIVCSFCGVHKDATVEDSWCSLRNPPGRHSWSNVPGVPPRSAESAILRQTATIGSIVIVVGFLVFNYWAEILNAGKITLAAVLGMIEWIASWPWSAWICISILYGARRIARSIERHGAEKEKAEK